MSSTKTAPLSETSRLTSPVLQPSPDTQVAERAAYGAQSAPVQGEAKRSGYGMPCAKCKTYYAANLGACPVCKTTERVSPTVASIPAAAKLNEQLPDPVALEAERERFLREFKAQTYASQMQINATSSLQCVKQENHGAGFEPAAICQGCYDHLQERVDVLEAALHMDVKEAAQVVYDAVWADPSDPTKTYQNAANALLAELRKRSGITPIFGPLSPLVD
jgi:hypothetical protein